MKYKQGDIFIGKLQKGMGQLGHTLAGTFRIGFVGGEYYFLTNIEQDESMFLSYTEAQLERTFTLKTSARWKPKMDEIYFFIDDLGDYDNNIWRDYEEDVFRYDTGNCFQTEEELEPYRQKLLALGQE